MRLLMIPYQVRPANIDEGVLAGESCDDYVLRMALEKARSVYGLTGGWVIGADTSVVLDGVIIGKPSDMADAVRMRTMLAGRAHQVMTAVSLVGDCCEECVLDVSTVHFLPMDRDDIELCCQHDQPLDKAGGYALQGYSAAYIHKVEGSPSGVMGLPLATTAMLLKKHGLYPHKL